jgi:DNA replication protein DnaC|nr:MAG TPA: replicative helicase [Caudoviricetes sp.]
MEPQQNKSEPQTISNQILIDAHIEKMRQEWSKIVGQRKTSYPKLSLNYDQFKTIVVAHGTNILARRGEEILFSIDRNNENAIHELYKYLSGDKSFGGSLSKGILLNGKYGSGKTLLMRAVCSTYNYYIKQFGHVTSQEMRFVKSSQIVDSFRKEKNDTEITEYKFGPLIIDELGREQKEVNVYGTVIQPMSRVLQDRYDSGAPTFAIANFKLETLKSEEYYGKMVGDRLRQMFNEIELTGESRRK